MDRVTIKDIADAVGISNQAVSAVLNGKTNCRVSAAKRDLIEATARRMNYHQNAVAATLRNGTSRLIGVLTDSCAGYRTEMILRHVERNAAARGYRIITSLTHDDVNIMRENCQLLFSYGVPGVICLAHDYPELARELNEAFAGDQRIVYLEKPVIPEVPYVATSCRKAMTELFADARRSGLSRFGIIHGDPVWQTTQALLDDYKYALQLNQLPFDPLLTCQHPYRDCPVPETGHNAIDNMIMPQRPQLLFSDDAGYALFIQNNLIAKGWRFPEDLMLYGGTDNLFFRYSSPPIGSFDPCYDDVAKVLLAGVIDRDSFETGTVIAAKYHTGTFNHSNHRISSKEK